VSAVPLTSRASTAGQGASVAEGGAAAAPRITVLPWPEWIRSGTWREWTDPSVPILPSIAHQAITIAADPAVTVTRLTDVVSKDPGLAMRVLRLANAAHCAPMQSITTLPEAVVRMGTAAVRNVVIAACLAARGRDKKVFGPDGLRQVDHAIGAAYMAQLCAKKAGWDRDEAFLAGLLHDVGELQLLRLARDYERCYQLTVSDEEIREVMVTEHAGLGSSLLIAWDFPRKLAEVTLHHHAPSDAAAHRAEAEVVHLADRLCRRYGFGCTADDPSIEDPLALVDDPECTRLALSEAWLLDVDAQAPGLFSKAREALT
jgi:HD-like signal output (HDOD) protein